MALIVVDMQNDFVSPDGSLAVPGAEAIIPVINNFRMTARNGPAGLDFALMVNTMDFHPANHCSFSTGPRSACESHSVDEVKWPPHCVQGTKGAELHPDLYVFEEDRALKKGMDADVDALSAFWDRHGKESSKLFEWLFDLNVDEVYVCGVAFDVCVAETAKDASIFGFPTYVLSDASCALDDGRRREASLMLSHFDVHIKTCSEALLLMQDPRSPFDRLRVDRVKQLSKRKGRYATAHASVPTSPPPTAAPAPSHPAPPPAAPRPSTPEGRASPPMDAGPKARAYAPDRSALMPAWHAVDDSGRSQEEEL